MRGDGMLELQELPENMLFCATETCHLGTAGRPAEPCEACDQQFAQLMSRVVGAGAGMASKAARTMSMRRTASMKAVPHPRIHPPENSKTPQVRSIPKRDSPV